MLYYIVIYDIRSTPKAAPPSSPSVIVHYIIIHYIRFNLHIYTCNIYIYIDTCICIHVYYILLGFIIYYMYSSYILYHALLYSICSEGRAAVLAYSIQVFVFVSSYVLRCRLLKCLLAHPMNHAGFEGRAAVLALGLAAAAAGAAWVSGPGPRPG